MSPHAPDLYSSASSASELRISICRRDNRAFRSLSSTDTTRYSTYKSPTTQTLSIKPSFSAFAARVVGCCSPHLPRAAHRALFLLLDSISREVAVKSEVVSIRTAIPLFFSPFLQLFWDPCGGGVFVHIFFCTSMPHSLTCPAFFFASGHSSGVPSALYPKLSTFVL